MGLVVAVGFLGYFQDMMEFHNSHGLLLIITESLPCTRLFIHTAISAVTENNMFQKISQSAKLSVKKEHITGLRGKKMEPR